MKKSYILFATVAAFTLSQPSFAVDKESYESKTKVEKDSDGNYSEKSKVEKTDAAGTTVTSERKVNVDVDSNGNVDKTVKTEETTDPKGLMNKQTVKTKSTSKTKDDGTTENTNKVIVNGKTVEDVSRTTKP